MTPNMFRLTIQQTPDNLWVADVRTSHLKYPEFVETPLSSASYLSKESLDSVFADLTRILTSETPAHDTQSPPH